MKSPHELKKNYHRAEFEKEARFYVLPINLKLVRRVLRQVLIVVYFYLWNRQPLVALQNEIIEINVA